jgi:hypothetical protein
MNLMQVMVPLRQMAMIKKTPDGLLQLICVQEIDL